MITDRGVQLPSKQPDYGVVAERLQRMETVEKLLLRNLVEVFGAADASKRAEAIASIWAPDGELVDPQGC